MSLTTRTLRLHLLSVLSAPLPGATVSLHLSTYQADDVNIVPLVWTLVEDPAVPGDYIGPVWPNTRGGGGTHYDLLVQANGLQLLSQIVTVPEGATEAVIRAKINLPPYPAVYEATRAVAAANNFSDAAGTSASIALAAAGQLGDVAAAVETAVTAAQLAVAADASRTEYEDRVYPGVYSSPPTNKPHSGAPAAQGDRCTILVGGIPYEHLRLGGGWVIPNFDAVQLAQAATLPMMAYSANEAQSIFDNALPMQSYSALRAYTGRATGVRITSSGIAGVFQLDSIDASSADNGGTILIDGSGRRWKRAYSGAVDVRWFGALGTGPGFDDAPAFAKAISVHAGKAIYVPDPPLAWRIASALGSIPAGTSIIGATRKKTLISHEFSGHLFVMGDGATVMNFALVGNGATHNGRCFQYSGSAGRQCVQGVAATDWEDEVVYFETAAGSQSTHIDVALARRNAGTGTGRYAVVIDPVRNLSAVPRRFLGLETNGQCSIHFGGSNNTYVVASTLGDLGYNDETRAALITGSRILNQASLLVAGHNNVIAGCDVLPQITIAPGTDNAVIGPNSYNTLPVLDNSGNSRNSVHHWAHPYTPELTTAGSPPTLGNGTITGRHSRSGSIARSEGQLVIGSTTNLGSGALRISLLQGKHAATGVTVGGAVYIIQGTIIYTGILVIAPGAAYATLVRDTTSSITFNSPVVLVPGSVIRWQVDYDV